LAEEAAHAVEQAKSREQALAMAAEMPEAEKGTLPPLYFVPPRPKLKRVPSGSKLNKPRLYRTKSGNLDAEKLEGRSTMGYPPSKPMHRSAAPSYLSPDAPLQNYRGFFNLGMILLVVSNFRILLDVIRRHGFVLVHLPQYFPSFPNEDPWADFPVFSGLVLLQKFILICFAVERFLGRKRLPEWAGMLLHHVNVHLMLATETLIVWNFVESPVKGGFLLMTAMICWMKLLSYVLANQDYRLSRHIDTHHATLAIIENLDPGAEEISYPQ
jgi:diacylglycerol O-acyltransferase-1